MIPLFHDPSVHPIQEFSVISLLTCLLRVDYDYIVDDG